MFEGAPAVWDDAYALASTNTTKDTDETGGDSERKGFSGSSKDKSQPQLSGSNVANNNPLTSVTNTVDDIMSWGLGKYIWEYFHGFHPVELFKVEDLLNDKENEKDDDKKDDDDDKKDDKDDDDDKKDDKDDDDFDEKDRK